MAKQRENGHDRRLILWHVYQVLSGHLGIVQMCWICGCADHVGLGNERPTQVEVDPNQLNDIIDS